MRIAQILTFTALLGSLTAFTGCGGTEYTYVPEAGEMQTGPGLISGEAGAFTLFEGKRQAGQVKEVPKE